MKNQRKFAWANISQQSFASSQIQQHKGIATSLPLGLDYNL